MIQCIDEHSVLALTMLCSLEQELDCTFSLWSEIDGWQPTSEEQLGLSAETYDLIRETLAQQSIGQSSQTFRLADGQQLLVVPIEESNASRLFVIGIVAPHAPKLVRALADALLATQRLAQQLEESEQLQHEYTEQITENYEELSWLRSISQHFEICDIRHDLVQVGQATLPALRPLIHAQSLLLLGIDRSVAHQGSPNAFTILYADGEQSTSGDQVRRVFANLSNDELMRLTVWNTPNFTDQRIEDGTVRNYILTPVTKSNEQVGWLLAINKCEPSLIQLSSHQMDRNWFEFGTTEAGLMSAMAILLATHARNYELLKEKDDLLLGVIRSLVNTIDAKDAYTYGHSDRVARMSKRIAHELGFSKLECEQIHMAGLLHDIGKIGVPDNILGKTAKLTDEETALMQRHPTIGVEILSHLPPFKYALPGVHYHHERIDGLGYPEGLAGDQIPMMSRIIAVADGYDAMTSDRVYRKGMPTASAEKILKNGKGSQWDDQVIDAFFSALPDFYAICGFAASNA